MSESLPTIGSEVELPWTAMLRQAGHDAAADILAQANEGFYELPYPDKAVVQSGFDAVDMRFGPKVEQAIASGLPKSGNDGYVEFALPPRTTIQESANDIARLYELGLLSEHQRYPLHITVSDIGSCAAAAYLLCAAEIMGDLPPDRVTERKTWKVKGRGGIKGRQSHELQLGATVGVELRSLLLTSTTQYAAVADVVQTGAHGINTQHPSWGALQTTLADELHAAGLPTQHFWGRFDHTTWRKYSEMLSDDTWRTGVQMQIAQYVAQMHSDC